MDIKTATSNNLQIEYIAVVELMDKLHPQNPKAHDLGAIIESYNAHGFVSPGTLDSRTGYFLCGHGRTEALAMMIKQKMDAPDGIIDNGNGWQCPVVVGYQSKSDTQALAYLAADNKLTIAGGWNEPQLLALLQEVANSTDVALEATGFDAEGLDLLLRDLEGYEDGEWSAEEHWVGLPEYEQGDEVSKLKMIVHFENEDDRQDFANRLDLRITEKTNNTWWPVKTQRDLQSIRFEVNDNG